MFSMQCYLRGPQMSSIWRPILTWVSPRIGVSLDTECFHFGAFYVSHGILWPEETFLWRQILGGVGAAHDETSVTLTGRGSL